MLETFTKGYGDRRYQHTAMVRHKGRLIAFAQDTDRRIHYAVLDLDDPSNASPLDHDHWPDNPLELQFPDEIAEVGAGVADQTTMPVVKKGSRVPATPEVHVDEDERDAFLSSTARLSELAPFQVLSDGRFVYLFRQAIASGHPDVLTVTPDGTVNADGQGAPLVDSTLLLDRFVLSGGRLETKMEVRYQRSRSRSRPQNNKDSLGARDMEE